MAQELDFRQSCFFVVSIFLGYYKDTVSGCGFGVDLIWIAVDILNEVLVALVSFATLVDLLKNKFIEQSWRCLLRAN